MRDAGNGMRAARRSKRSANDAMWNAEVAAQGAPDAMQSP
jgi:hypothetical protein